MVASFTARGARSKAWRNKLIEVIGQQHGVKRRLRAPKGVQAKARQAKVLFEFGDPIFRIGAVSVQPPDLDWGERQIGHKQLIPIPGNILQQFPLRLGPLDGFLPDHHDPSRLGPPLRLIGEIRDGQPPVDAGPGRQARQHQAQPWEEASRYDAVEGVRLEVGQDSLAQEHGAARTSLISMARGQGRHGLVTRGEQDALLSAEWPGRNQACNTIRRSATNAKRG